MAKSIVYLITEHGMDGRAPETIMFASMVEETRDRVFDNSKNRVYYNKVDRIIDIEEYRKGSLAKLNGIDRMILGCEQRVIK